jgi:flagellar biosynthesis/type III secretory pathway M-ring protein FliF/YscJ|tara:strand:- start:4437 stop:4841 length:405 start_codon:yes stop_codon:yes gene_type:complete
MTWLVIKHWLKRFWLWLKTNWWAGVLLIGGFILYKVFFKSKKTSFTELYEKKIEQGKKELEVINKAHEEEVRQIKQAQKDFKVVVDALKEEREEQGEKIKKEEKKRIKEIVKMPEEERASALADEFGFELVEVE